MTDNRPRLWCVTELYYPEQGTAAHLLTQTAEGLAADFDVHILCGQPDYFETGKRAAARELRNGTSIVRVRGTRFAGRSLFFRLINALTFTAAIFVFALLNFRKGDRILAATNPPPIPVMIGLAAKLRGCHSTLLVHDVYPDVLLAAGAVKGDSIVFRLLIFIFGRSYAMFDSFVVLGDCMQRVVQRKLGQAKRGISVIPNWADDDIFPIERLENSFRTEHGLADKFIVQFSGNFGLTHDVELLLDAAKLLADRSDIIFLFIGAGAKTGLLGNVDEAPGNVVFLPRQPREKLRDMLNASDVTVISFIDGMLGLSVPSRMYNIMAAGVPIIASADPGSELARELKASDSGWVLGRSEAHEMANLIRSLASLTGTLEVRRKGDNARQAVMERYLYHHAIALYRKALR